MTLSTEIAAMTGDKGDRAIDARVADLLGWWPDEYTRHCVHGRDRRYKATRGHMVSTEYVECPHFTTSLDPTIAEIRRRDLHFCGGTALSEIEDDPGAWAQVWNNYSDIFRSVERKDDNLALAALEALVRAVEGQG